MDSGSERRRISEVELCLTHLAVWMFVFTCSALVLLLCVVSCSQTSQAETRAPLPQPAPPVQEMLAFTFFFFPINFPDVGDEQLCKPFCSFEVLHFLLLLLIVIVMVTVGSNLMNHHLFLMTTGHQKSVARNKIMIQSKNLPQSRRLEELFS